MDGDESNQISANVFEVLCWSNSLIYSEIIHTAQKFWGQQDFERRLFERSLISPRLHLFDQKTVKTVKLFEMYIVI